MWNRNEASIVKLAPMTPEDRMKKTIDRSFIPVGTVGVLNDVAGQWVAWDGAHWIDVPAETELMHAV
jgi:hypothetical protein